MPGHMSNYPGGFNFGLTIRNMPVINIHGGNVFWVHSGTGSDGNPGTFSKPFATLSYAVGRCTASQGDMIFAKPGHAETVTSTIVVNVAGVSIIGIGNGTNRPNLTQGTSGSDNVMEISANNIRSIAKFQ